MRLTAQQFHDDFRLAHGQIIPILILPDEIRAEVFCRHVGRMVKMLKWQASELSDGEPLMPIGLYVRDLLSLITSRDFPALKAWSDQPNKVWFRKFAKEYKIFRGHEEDVAEKGETKAVEVEAV